MKYTIIAVALIFVLNFTAINAKAQHAGIFVHALYAAPLSTRSNDFYSGGVGAEGGILAGKKTTRLAASLGYSHFFSRNDINDFGDKTYVPVKLGVRQYLPLTLNIIFLQADAGIGFVSYKHTDETNSPFAYDFQAGVKFTAFEAAIGWDTFHAINPSGWSSWFTVKAGINLGF